MYLWYEEDIKDTDNPDLFKELEERVGHKKFIKINDTSKVKIRFSDLPISKYTSRGTVQS